MHCSFLGYVDLRGGAYEANVLATGFGAYVAIPLLRKNQRDDMTYAALCVGSACTHACCVS